MTSPAQDRATARPASRRKLLLNPRFQLKYTGLLVSVVLAVMVALGLVIWQTASVANEQARYAATQAELALKEAANSAKILRMSTAAMGGDGAELGSTLDEELEKTNREYERNLAEVASGAPTSRRCKVASSASSSAAARSSSPSSACSGSSSPSASWGRFTR